MSESDFGALLARLSENLTNPLNVNTTAADIGLSPDTATSI
jgi:hypothetical protein